MVILAALMFIRMRAEVMDSLGPHAGGTAIIIGLALALVSILANPWSSPSTPSMARPKPTGLTRSATPCTRR